MILSITIVAILIMAVAVPIFSDATKPAVQLNDCRYGAIQSSEDLTMTISWADGVTNFKATTGEDMDFSTSSGSGTFAIMAESVLIEVYYQASGYGLEVASISATPTTTSPMKSTTTLTLKDGTLTYEKEAFAASWIIYPSASGTLGCINEITASSSTLGAWANEGQTIYWAQAGFGSLTGMIIGTGDPWHVATIECKAYKGGTAWTGNPSSVTILEDGSRAKKFGALVFDDPVLSTFSEVHVVFAPLEYLPNTTSGGSSDQVNTLVNLIPMIMVAGLVTAVAASYVRKKMEE